MDRSSWLGVKNTTLFVCALLLMLMIGSSAAPAYATLNVFRVISAPIGVCVHSLDKEEAELLSTARLDWIRADVAEIPGVYSFLEISSNAKNQGAKVLGILDIWTMKWNWNFSISDWETTVSISVNRYKENVDAWEIWNEPEFPSNPISPEQYYTMLRTAYDIIKTIDSDSRVIMGGGLHLNTGGDPWLDRDKAFAKRLAELGADQYADGISFHAYPWARIVDTSVWTKYDESLSYYNSIFEKSMENWITETSHPAEFDGERSQAQYLVDAIDFFNKKGIVTVFWYEFRDNPRWTPQSPTFGLLTESLQPRLAFLSIRYRTTNETSA